MDACRRCATKGGSRPEVQSKGGRRRKGALLEVVAARGERWAATQCVLTRTLDLALEQAHLLPSLQLQLPPPPPPSAPAPLTPSGGADGLVTRIRVTLHHRPSV